MSRAREMIEELSSEYSGVGELTREGITKAFMDRFRYLGIEDVYVDDVSIDYEGDISVTLVDDDNDELNLIFMVDGDDDSIIAMVDDIDAEGHDDEEVIIIDLSALNPPIKMIHGVGNFVNLADLAWINKSTMMSLLRAGDIGVDATNPDTKPKSHMTTDTMGNQLGIQRGELSPFEAMLDEMGVEYDEVIFEGGTARVVRGGKVVRLPIVRRVRRRVLTSKQRQGFRKAALKRRSKRGQTARKRKRSLRIRKTSGVKRRTGNTTQYRVQGGANRKR